MYPVVLTTDCRQRRLDVTVQIEHAGPACLSRGVRGMTLSESPGSLKRFRRTPWRFQQTFRTPLKKLQPFVATIVSTHEPFQTASITIDEVVFEPKHLMSLLS